jgi:tRNA U34 5-carboxymethylaminomethyl modifying enzyme MnmG/GidA
VAHAGLDKVPTTGTYLLEKGERVVTEKTSAKLDRKLDQVGGNASNNPAQTNVVNFTINATDGPSVLRARAQIERELISGMNRARRNA